MFFTRRATQAEYCDRPNLSAADLADNYRQLARVNRVALATDPFQRLLVRWLGRRNVTKLSLLDLGAGDGSIGRSMERWAQRHGWDWRVTNLDAKCAALRLGSNRRSVAASVCALPFADDSFDVVIASQMTHHLTDEEVVGHFREAWRVSRDAVFFADAHRNVGVWCALWLVLRLMRVTPQFRSDGLLSIQRGWRLGEWRELARQAGIPQARVWLYYGSRVILQARKLRAGEALRVVRSELEPDFAVAP
jgi:hypothetical protein